MIVFLSLWQVQTLSSPVFPHNILEGGGSFHHLPIAGLFFPLELFFEFPLLDINLSSSRSRNYICNKPAPSGRRGRNETGIVIAKVEHLPAISTKVKSLDRLKIMLAKSEPETNKPSQGIKSINITHAVAPGFYSEMSSLVGIQVGWGTKKKRLDSI